MLEVTALSSRYGRIPALVDVDLRVGQGELVALVGANGAGKTTLLRAISGVQPCSGRIVYDGQDISALSAERRIRLESDGELIGYTPVRYSVQPRALSL